MFEVRYGHMVQEWILAEVADAMRKRRRIIGELETRGDAERYVESIRRKVRGCFAPFPARTALKPRTTGRLEMSLWDIEKIVFQSRPGLFVSGNLYLPKKLEEKNPAVLGLCGHSPEGKAAAGYQEFCQALAQKGFVVLIIDPISQGERRQFFPRDGGKRPPLCHAHNLMGNQMLLTGDFFGTWRVWDAIRALDYLLSRPEVDPTRVGVTGNSGGGTLTAFASALDPRFTMAAPSCYICSVEANVANEIPADAEQNPPGFLAKGLDHVDLLLARAPRPTLILGQKHDFFSARHTLIAAEEMRKVHSLLGKEENAEVFIGPTVHGYSIENRQAMVAFFMRHAGIKGDAADEKLEILPVEELNATKSGTSRMKGAKRVFEFTARKAAKLAGKRRKLSVESLRAKLADVLKLGDLPEDPPNYRVLYFYGSKVLSGHEFKQAEFAVETEPGIQAILGIYGKTGSMMVPPAGNLNVYVGHVSGQGDLREVPEVAELASKDVPLVVVDPRGIGQSTSKACGDTRFFHPYGSDYMYAVTCDMLGKSYVGRRVFDVLRSLDFLYDNGAEDITLIGRGLNSITAAFAALLHERAPKVELMDYLPSFQMIIDNPIHKWPASVFPSGILKYFDLPDVYSALGRRLSKKSRWNAIMR